jgi:signal transduction histidine kinase
MTTLYAIEGPIKGESFDITKDITTVGRASDNDICLSDGGVSRHHAKLLKKGKRISIVDLNSTRGVFIDGERIKPDLEVSLHKKSQVLIGHTVLSLQKKALGKEAVQPLPRYEQKRLFDFKEVHSNMDGRRYYTRNLELLLKVSNILAQSLDIDELLDEMIDQIFILLKRIDRGAILLKDRETGQLKEMVSKIRMGERSQRILSTFNYSRSIVKRVFNEGVPITMSDTRRVSKTDLSDSMAKMNIMSVMCVPLKYKGEVQGVIYVDSIGLPDGFRKDDIQLLTSLSNTAAISIENARLYQELKKELVERKRAEKEKTKLEAQYRFAQKMEALGTLASGIAHNFNNLLMGIQGYTSLMLMDIDSTHPNYARLRGIESQIGSGAILIKQLLGYAREVGYELRTLNLNQLVKEIADNFCITNKEIRVHQELARDLYRVKADHRQMKQALLNLFVNAADAMPKGGEIFLKTMNVTDVNMRERAYTVEPGNYVLLSITDTGTGMDEKTSERIFEPFFTTKGLSKATGLGLASAYGIIKAHGGYIDVNSEKGKGTTFRIYLPVI